MVGREETPRSEDYLEAVYNLIRDKGYATTTDISEMLKVKPPTVTSMISKLAGKGYLEYEPYKGMRLTELGEKVALSVIKRHKVIAEFLLMLGVDEDVAYQDTEGIEHHVQASTINRIKRLAEYFKKNPQHLRSVRDYINSCTTD